MEAIECKCRKISKLATEFSLPPEWYYCKKCFNAFLKKRKKFIKDLSSKDIRSTINYEKAPE